MGTETKHTEPKQLGDIWRIEFTTATGARMTFDANTRESAMAIVDVILDRQSDPEQSHPQDEITSLRKELAEARDKPRDVAYIIDESGVTHTQFTVVYRDAALSEGKEGEE